MLNRRRACGLALLVLFAATLTLQAGVTEKLATGQIFLAWSRGEASLEQVQQHLADLPRETLKGVIAWLGQTPYVKDVVEAAMNARGGALDRFLNEISIADLHRTTPLPNFGQVCRGLYRGGEPSEEGYRLLRDRYGITDVVNLRGEDDSRRAIVTGLGMRYHYLPIPDTHAPTMPQAMYFSYLVSEVARRGGAVFVHCAQGQSRTGTMVGIVRLDQGWKLVAVRREMERYGWNINALAQYSQWEFLYRYSRIRRGKTCGQDRPLH